MIAVMGASESRRFALESALRAAIVVPVAFAVTLVGIGSKQMALFAAFGGMAMLAFVDFGGSRGERLRAYLALIGAGGALIALGTICSGSAWLATIATALVAFGVLFAGALSEYAAAAHSAAMLTFVLGVMVPGEASAIPTRLAGWGLAGGLSLLATLVLWPRRPRGELRRQCGEAAAALAELVRARAGGEEGTRERAGALAEAATGNVRRLFLGLEHRPSGTSSRTAALARLVDDIGWLQGAAARAPGEESEAGLWRERVELEAAVADALGALAARLELGEERDEAVEGRAEEALGRLQEAHEALGGAFVGHSEGWREEWQERAATRELDEAFALRQVSFATMQTARDGLLACGEAVAGDPLGSRRAQIEVAGRLARTHANVRSAWFRDSVRASVGLSLAVLIGQLSDLEHSFWIVLGTMSVLRSNALATGATMVQALVGTFGGILVGGALVAALAGDEAALWAILPFAVLLATYAPRAISFGAGQAAFSLTVLVLFNLIEPAGWKVGLVRVEDVAIGAGVSLLVGLLAWPRGAAGVLRRALGAAYERSAGYLEATIDGLLGHETGVDGGEERRAHAAREATASGQVLDATVRGYLSERSSARGSLEDLTVLVAGATRARRVARMLEGAQAFARLAPVGQELPRLWQAREAFDGERRALCQWYEALGESIATGAEMAPAAQRLDGGGEVAPGRVVLERAVESNGAVAPNGPPAGLAIAWAHRHLLALAALEPALGRAGERIAGAGEERADELPLATVEPPEAAVRQP
jgi:uncharacterized membrane protein YccC